MKSLWGLPSVPKNKFLSIRESSQCPTWFLSWGRPAKNYTDIVAADTDTRHSELLELMENRSSGKQLLTIPEHA